MFKILESLLSTLKTFTIEPVIFFFILGNYILIGSQVPTNILIYKICRYELNYAEEICNNLGDESQKNIEDEVQKKANSFLMTAQWLNNIPGIIFAVYAAEKGSESLTPAKVYTVLSIFNLIANPMRLMVMTLINFMNATASLARILVR